MKTLLRFALLMPALLLLGRSAVQGQVLAPRVHNILIRHVGPPAVSDEFIRANIRTKTGEPFARPTVDETSKISTPPVISLKSMLSKKPRPTGWI